MEQMAKAFLIGWNNVLSISIQSWKSNQMETVTQWNIKLKTCCQVNWCNCIAFGGDKTVSVTYTQMLCVLTVDLKRQFEEVYNQYLINFQRLTGYVGQHYKGQISMICWCYFMNIFLLNPEAKEVLMFVTCPDIHYVITKYNTWSE